jgi:protein-S-isoprenylcysteine O-methyltransferase Ste14
MSQPTGTPAIFTAARTVAAWQTAFNLVFLALFMLMSLAAWQNLLISGSLRALSVLAVNVLFLGLFLARRPARAESSSLGLWILGMVTMLLPLLLRVGGQGWSDLGAALQVAGLAGIAGGLLSLRRSFAVAPANRGVRDTGMYRIVRHPIYLSELLLLLGVVLANPTLGNLLILICECGLQAARARAEEQFLSSDPVYRAYRERVRYQLIPGVI